MKNLKVDLSLEKELNIWKVRLSVYEGERKLNGVTAAVQ
jgi:hypothetical protein